MQKFTVIFLPVILLLMGSKPVTGTTELEMTLRSVITKSDLSEVERFVLIDILEKTQDGSALEAILTWKTSEFSLPADRENFIAQISTIEIKDKNPLNAGVKEFKTICKLLNRKIKIADFSGASLQAEIKKKPYHAWIIRTNNSAKFLVVWDGKVAHSLSVYSPGFQLSKELRRMVVDKLLDQVSELQKVLEDDFTEIEIKEVALKKFEDQDESKLTTEILSALFTLWKHKKFHETVAKIFEKVKDSNKFEKIIADVNEAMPDERRNRFYKQGGITSIRYMFPKSKNKIDKVIGLLETVFNCKDVDREVKKKL